MIPRGKGRFFNSPLGVTPATNSSALQAVEIEHAQKGWIFDIQRYSVNDGPGIRTTIFFKGCPLRCIWCDNPESQSQDELPQLFFFGSSCVRCHRCVDACPTGATAITSEGSIEIDRGKCVACGQCVRVCLSEARAMSGKIITVDEVFEIVRKDLLFYQNSGGGVTASGGEPTSQPGFLIEIFKRCQESSIHTVLDTCGYVRWEVLERVLDYTDLVLFDLKGMDPVRHKEVTGVDNELILQNASRTLQKGKLLKVRMPLIPGCNDSDENIRAAGEFIARLGIKDVDILPYHRLGASKYERLGSKYELWGIKSYTEEQVEKVKELLNLYGLVVSIA